MSALPEQWLYFAEQDLAFAKAGFEDGFFAHVCALSQQAVEKTIKAYLSAQKIPFPKIHGLLRLRDLMRVRWLEPHVDALKQLSDFYVPLRYPDAMVGSLPTGLPGEPEARRALEWADAICQLIRKHL